MTSTHITITHDHPAIIQLKTGLTEYAKIATNEEGALTRAFGALPNTPANARLRTFINGVRVAVSGSKTAYRSRISRVDELGTLVRTHDTYDEFGTHMLQISHCIFHRINTPKKEDVDAKWIVAQKAPVEFTFMNGLAQFDRLLNGMISAQEKFIRERQERAAREGEEVQHVIHVSIVETVSSDRELEDRLKYWLQHGTRK